MRARVAGKSRALCGYIALIGLAGCTTGMARTSGYGWHTADARVHYGGRVFSVYVHPRDDTLMVQPSLADTMSRDALSTRIAELVLEEFLQGTSCKVSEPKQITSGTFEASYVCAAGFDLRRAMAAERPELTQGGRLNGSR